MRWLVIYLLAMAVIWLFMKSGNVRHALMAVVTLVFLVLIALLTLTSNEDVTGRAGTEQHFDTIRQSEAARYGSLKPDDIAIRRVDMRNSVTTVFDSTGREISRKDPLRWKLEIEIANRSTNHIARDVGLRVRLYACPVFFDTAQEQLTPEALKAACNEIAQRRVGLEGIGLEPGAAHTETREITFPNQPELRNPRYWLDVQTVSSMTGG